MENNLRMDERLKQIKTECEKMIKLLDANEQGLTSWWEILDENRKKLTGEQADQLNKPRSFAPNLNDIWIFKLSDQDKYVE